VGDELVDAVVVDGVVVADVVALAPVVDGARSGVPPPSDDELEHPESISSALTAATRGKDRAALAWR
jgi:hypothetical protein